MKNQILLIGISFFLFIAFGNAQSWGEDGAKWVYNYDNFFGYTGYSEVIADNDTLIAGQAVKVLKRKISSYRYNEGTTVIDLAPEFMYEKDGVVFRWTNNVFDTLYNFNAAPGSTWGIDKVIFDRYDYYAHVKGTGVKNVEGTDLRWLAVEHEMEGNQFLLKDTIIEKIGSTNYYMLPWDYYLGSGGDMNVGGSLRCYTDTIIGNFNINNNTGENCYYIATNVEDHSTTNTKIKLLPNPFTNYIKIGFSEPITSNFDIIIYSIEGRIIKQIKLPTNVKEFEVLTTDLHSGYYLFTLTEQGVTKFATKIIKI